MNEINYDKLANMLRAEGIDPDTATPEQWDAALKRRQDARREKKHRRLARERAERREALRTGDVWV